MEEPFSRRRLRRSALRAGPGDPRRHPRVLLEQQEERAHRSPVALFGDGGGAPVRRQVPQLEAEARAEEVLRQVQPPDDLRARRPRPAPHQRGKRDG